MDIGLALEVLDHHDSKHVACIDLDVEEYVRHYLPAAEIFSDDPLACLRRDEMEKILELESSFFAMRRDKYLCR